MTVQETAITYSQVSRTARNIIHEIIMNPDFIKAERIVMQSLIRNSLTREKVKTQGNGSSSQS